MKLKNQSIIVAPNGGGVQPGHIDKETNTDILIIADDDRGADNFASELIRLGYRPAVLRFQDPLSHYLPGAVRLVLLVMKKVTEQGFGVAIKINTIAPAIPVVFAAPGWTRSSVLRAVKYGAGDILLTPALPEDIKEKIVVNLEKIID